MANKTISELTEATQVNNQDLFVLQQSGVAKKLSGQKLLDYSTPSAYIKNAQISQDGNTLTLTKKDNSTINFSPSGGGGGIYSNANLLINPWFEVNQRQVTNFTVGKYGIDRWKLVSGSASVVNGGIQLNGTLRQILEYPVENTVFASVKMTSF